MNSLIGKHIVRLDRIDSTNNYANSQMATADLPAGTVFLAYHQDQGRGQPGNYWESEAGNNLAFSLVLYPGFLEIRHQFMLSKMVALGIHSALNKHVDQLKIKWPNDVYAGNKKLGGILIENSIMGGLIQSSVIGIGINVNQTQFVSNAPNPVSLKILTNQHFDLEVLLAQILEGIDHFYALLAEGNDQAIDRDFLSVLFGINETRLFKSEHGIFRGTIRGVNEIGQLLIETPDNTVLEFHFKEVEFLFDE